MCRKWEEASPVSLLSRRSTNLGNASEEEKKLFGESTRSTLAFEGKLISHLSWTAHSCLFVHCSRQDEPHQGMGPRGMRRLRIQAGLLSLAAWPEVSFN